MRTALVVTALVLAACSGGTATSTGDVQTTSSTSAEVTTTIPQSASTATTAGSETSPSTRPTPNPDRPLAPDFSLTLSDGTVYEYASEVRPVFMVFWAEW